VIRQPMFSLSRTVLVVAAVAALAMFLAACGSSSSDSTSNEVATGSDQSTSSKPVSAALNSELAEGLEQGYAGTFTAPPTTSPPPAPGKDIWLISFAQSESFSAVWSEAGERAGKALGWETHVFDAKGEPNTALEGIRTAIAAKADAIVIYVFDCKSIKAGIEQAKKAGIVVIADQSEDCAPSLYNYDVTYNPASSPEKSSEFEGYLRGWGGAFADWLAAESHESAKVIGLKDTDYHSAVVQYEGFAEQLEKCSGCEVVDQVNFVLKEIGPALQQKVEQALLKNPEANAVAVPVADSVMTSGVAQTLKASGRLETLLITGGEGQAPNIELIRNKEGQDVANCQSNRWDVYSVMDAANRIFNGEEPVINTGNGFQLVDREHNMPPKGSACLPMKNGKPIEFEALYEEAWAAGK
jgi:ribose transport system substrate-binding protein